MATENTAFENRLGLGQGREAPAEASPTAGTWVHVLGNNIPGQYEFFEYDDRLDVACSVSTVGIQTLNVRLWFKQPQLPNRTVYTGVKLYRQGSTLVSSIAAGSKTVVSVDPHGLAVGDRIKIANLSWYTDDTALRQKWTVTEIVDASTFKVDFPTGHPASGAGARFGLSSARIYATQGFSELDIGRKLVVANSTYSGNNGTYEIVGLRQQVGSTTVQQAYLRQPSADVGDYDDQVLTPTLSVIGTGSRWRARLASDNGVTRTVLARCIPRWTQSGYWKADLRAYVGKIETEVSFIISLDLIEQTTNDIYPME